MRANLVALSFLGPRADLRIRARTSSGWSVWRDVEYSDNGPDGPDIAATVSEPIWVGTADRVAVRLSVPGAVRDVRLDAVNTLGNAYAPGLLSRVGTVLGALVRSPAAHAATIQPFIVPRAGWGANEAYRTCCPRYADAVRVGIVHHTDTTNSYSSAEAPGVIRAIYYYHTHTRGFDDIAYNFLIDRYGTIYEGRAGGVDRPVIGAHTAGMNTGTTGFALIGNFTSALPTQAAGLALERLIAWKFDVHHIPVSGSVQMVSGGSDLFAPGSTVTMNRLSGHRDAQATGCPGTRAYEALPTYRKAAAAIGLPKIYVTPPGTLRPDADGMADTSTLSATFSETLSYRVVLSDARGVATKVVAGSGSGVSVAWNGTDAATGAPGATGVAEWAIEAWGPGRVARPAAGTFALVGDHPDGTALSSAGTRVFLEEGQSRAITSDAVAASWFGPDEVVPTGPGEVARYAPGGPLGFRDGTIVVTPDGTYHVVFGGGRRDFASPEVYAALGYTAASAIPATLEEIEALPAGQPVEDASQHPEGAVVTDSSGGAFVLGAGERRKVPSIPVRASWYRAAEVVPATQADLAQPESGAVSFRPGTVLKTPDGAYWIASDGARRRFPSSSFLAAMGYKTSAAIAVTSAEAAILPVGQPIGAADPVTRVAGDDRVATSIAASEASFGFHGADAVVLARSDGFADALAGIPLAVAKKAPLLLTPGASLDSRTRYEILRTLSPGKTVYLLGGVGAVSDAVRSRIASLGYAVARFAGADRFSTALAIAREGLGNPDVLLLASGTTFPDALAGGAAAAKAGGAVLLTNGSTMPASVAAYIASRQGVTRFALGGPAAAADPEATPIVGADRYETARKVAEAFFTAPTRIGVASGVNFPDALSGGVHVAALSGPLLLGEPAGLPTAVRDYLAATRSTVSAAFVYGGGAVLSDLVRAAVKTGVN
jgi:putative cell wall-binding protein